MKYLRGGEEEDGAYGVIPTTVTTASSGENAHSTAGVAFRSLTKIARLQDRHSHSQQHSKDVRFLITTLNYFLPFEKFITIYQHFP